MKKYAIEKLEKALNKKIRTNSLVLGFDVAELNTGICVIYTDLKYLYIEDMDKIQVIKSKDITGRMDEFLKKLLVLKRKYVLLDKEFKAVVIEDCWLGNNVWTLKMLCRFSTIVYLGLRDRFTYQYFMQPNSARSKIGFKKNKADKRKVKEQVNEYLVKTVGIGFDDNDIMDGFVLALAGILKDD